MMTVRAPADLGALAQEYEEAATRFLQDLVRIPSVNGRENEAALAERIRLEADTLGFEARLVGAQAERPNVLVQWGEGLHRFALVGHMDTVPEGDLSDWTYAPFAAHIEDGKLFGRGVADNKAGLACGLYTMALMRDHQLLDVTQAAVLLAGVVDEESGASSPLGVRYLLDEGHLQARAAIYTYTSDIICVGHRGLLRLLLKATGKAIHSGSGEWSRGEDGVNAVTGLAAILVALESLEMPAPEHPAFANLNFTITPGTVMRGGVFESMVPANAEAVVDVRLMPDQPVEDVLAAIESLINAEIARRPGLHVTYEVKTNLPSAAIAMEHQLVKTAQQHTRTITGQAWPVAGAGPANEGYMLIEAGIPTLCGFGPTGGNAHAPDEWVALASLPHTIAMYAGIIRDYLNNWKANPVDG